MIQIRENYRLGMLVALVSIIALVGCSSNGGDEIPITTSSAEALEHFKLGRDLTERLRNPDAQRHFQRAIKADPEFALAYLYLAQTNPSPKGFFKNIQLAEKYSSGVSKGELLLIEASLAGADGNPTRQLEICRTLTDLYPKDVRARMLLANQYFGIQDYESAVAQYEAVIEIDNSFAGPYNMLGYSQRALGEYEKAADAFKQYIELMPDDPNPYDSYAELLTRMGKFEDAIEHYERALKADPTFGASRLGIASNLVLLNRHDDARAELSEYFDRAINSGQQRAALMAGAATYVDEGAYDQALGLLLQRYELDAEISDAVAMASDQRNLAFVQILNHQQDAAESSIDKALDIIDNSDLFERVKDNARLDDLAARALLEMERGNLSEARSRANEYLVETQSAGNVIRVRGAHLVSGRVALAEGEYDSAIAHLEQGNQELGWTRFQLAAAYEGNGELSRAAEMYISAATTYELNNLGYAAIRQEAKRRAEALIVP